MTVKSKVAGKKSASKRSTRSTFTRKDTVTDTAKKAKAVKVVDADIDKIERKAVERYQRKHGKGNGNGIAGKYGEPPAKPTRTVRGLGVDVLAGFVDPHTRTAASEVFDTSPENVTAEQRRAAKTINYGKLYGNSPAENMAAFRSSVRSAIRNAANPNPRAFRPLNSRELGKLSAELIKLNPKGGPRIPAHHPLADAGNASRAMVSYENMQGGFCVCIVLLHLDRNVGETREYNPVTYLWRGASRRSYKDKPNDVKGQLQAFERAILFSRAERVPV